MRIRVVAFVAAIVAAYVAVTSAARPARLVAAAPGSNLVIQTTAALVAVFVAVIALGRFRQRRRAGDLMLVLALAQLAAANLVFTALPLARQVGTVHGPSLAVGTVVRLVGALLLAAAAFARHRYVDEPRLPFGDQAVVVLVTGALLSLAAVVAWLLPDAPAAAAAPGHRLWDVSPALSAISGVTAAAAAAGAVGFLKAHRREPDDELLGWLAIACVLSAGSHATAAVSFLEPYSTYVSGAGLLKLGCYLLLLAGVAREVRGTWRDRAAAAVAEERRRIARDLHDGLAQELAYIVTRSRLLARRTGDEDIWAVCSAAERALDESRRAIAALTRLDDEPLALALAYTAEDVAGRLGTKVTLELDPAIDVPGETREALLRIAREAITNAARHGAATRVHVRLHADGSVRMRVSDNGRGFDAASAPAAGRLGVTGMRERAAALGAELTISSRRPGGTDVEVVLP